MLTIDFRGWFQCRLATDPDPYDEPRGVSGYVRAYAGEPDLDRIVHWQSPPFSRSLGPKVGVVVSSVAVDGNAMDQSPLTGARTNLYDSPKFEGRNGVLAEDGFEPLYPFDLEISNQSVTLRRAVVPYDEDFPFEGLLAAGVDLTGAAEIQRATGIASLTEVWKARIEQLKGRADTTEPQFTARRERIKFLEQNLSAPLARSAARFFGARMNFSLTLNRGNPTVLGLTEALGFVADVNDPWEARFWLGGWDADVLCGFCSGRLTIPRKAEPIVAVGVPLPRGVHRDEV